MPSATSPDSNSNKIPSSAPPDHPTSPSRVKSPPLPVAHPSYSDPPPVQHQHQHQHQQQQQQQKHHHPSPPHPAPSQPPTTSRPPPNATSSTPRPPPNSRPPQSRRNTAHRASRVGRPPNINENCLMRRLECVMAVESGRMSMLSACQQYEISARTFYRWLRDKHRLIELTGFSEDDFRANPPWSTPTPPPPHHRDDNHIHLVHDPQPQFEPHDNLPKLSQPSQLNRKPSSASASVPHPHHTPSGRDMTTSYMGMKRRFPKGSDARAQYNSHEDRYRTAPGPGPGSGSGPGPGPGPAPGAGGGGGVGGGSSASQAVYYARRSFTKMPSSKNVPSHEPSPTVDRSIGRTSTRMKRPQEWEQEPDPPFHEEDRTFGAMYEESRSDSPAEPYKRRKVVREHVMSGDEAMEVSPEDARTDTMVDSPAHDVEYTNGSGYGEKLRSQGAARDITQQRVVQQRSIGHVQTGGKTAVDGNGSGSDFGKHRIEIMMGRRKVSIAWYEGARTEDIKAAISRRFALLPGTQWALMDKNLDEIVVSPGIPSGRYTLTVFS